MFSNDDIIRMAGRVTYERGRQLYDAGYVLDMDVQTEGDYDVIAASVRGSGRKVYETDLLILRETGELEECYCECPAFRSYDGICKHCVAVWLQYRAEEGYEEEEDGQLTLDSIPGVRRGFQKHTSPELAALFQRQALKKSLPVLQNDTYGKVKLEPEFTFNGYSFVVSFKIGVSRMYVLKDVLEFEELMRNEADHSYGKNLQFHHTLQAFAEEWRLLAEFLVRWADNYRQAHMRVSYGGYYLDFSDKVRDVYLKGNDIAEFLLSVKGKTIHGNVVGTRKKDWQVTEERLPRTLAITGEKDGIELKTSKFTYGGATGVYRVYFHEGKIYLESKKDLEPILDFLDSMTALGDRAGFIEKKDVPLFCRDYLPVLKQYFKCRMSGFDPADYQMELTKLKVYLDAPQRNMLTARPVAVLESRSCLCMGQSGWRCGISGRNSC